MRSDQSILRKSYNTWVKGDTIKFRNLKEHAVAPEFISSMNRLVKKFKHKKIGLDFSEIDRVSPSPIVPLAGYIEYYKAQGIEFEIKGEQNYLTNTHFYEPLVPTEDNMRGRGLLDKIWRFENSSQVYLLVINLMNNLRKLVVCEKGVIESCEWGLNEILDNVIQHSETKKGFIMAQLNRTTKILNICVFDYGVGIFKTMKKTAPYPKSPVDAISLSIQEGKKGAKSVGQGNGMWGLYNIVNQNNCHLTIISGTGGIYFANNRTKTLKDLYVLSFKNQATAVNFNLNLNKETLLTDAIKGFTFVDLYTEGMQDDSGKNIFKISNVASGTGTRESAIEIKNELLNLYKNTHKNITIDFENVGLISSSFADELIGKLIVDLGFFQYQKIFHLSNMNPTIQSILHRSVTQRLYEEFSKSMD